MTRYSIDPVAEFYRQTGVRFPTLSLPIAPLGELIGSFNLIQVELSGLTGQTAAKYLAVNSAPVSQLDSATDDPLAGFLYATSRHAVLFVERNDLIVRRRFSVAHELGHYWLHYVLQHDRAASRTEIDNNSEPVIFVDTARSLESDGDEAVITEEVATTGATLPTQNQMEYEADLFASRLLMPSYLVKALVERYRPGFDGGTLIRRLASDLLVSRLAIRIRLRELGLLN